MPETFHFLRPGLLLLIPVAVGVWWLWQRRADPLRGWRSQIDPELLGALADHPESAPPRRWPWLIGWVLAIVASAGPAWRLEPSAFAEDVSPLVILLKADLSMDTPDPAPSRIERAQLKIRDLAAARKGQPLGLVVYAGSAHLVLPPTRDTDAVATMAGEITPGIMPAPGDRLDLAIETAAELIGHGGGSLLVITDTATRDHSGLAQARAKAGSPQVQILALTAEGASTSALDGMARSLEAELLAMTTDTRDIERIVRKAARPPLARDGENLQRWQDGGFYLVPALALLALLPFRRESKPSGQP